MVKKSLCFIALAALFSCEQQKNSSETVAVKTKQAVIESAPEIKASDKEAGWLNPQYLIADFNGDGHSDTAFAVVVNNKKGIRIKHGNTKEEFIIGAGNKFGNGGDDFDWVEIWNLVTDKTTMETTFKEDGDILGGREVRLENSAFYLGTEEEGGATVAWKDGKYVWIHQAG